LLIDQYLQSMRSEMTSIHLKYVHAMKTTTKKPTACEYIYRP